MEFVQSFALKDEFVGLLLWYRSQTDLDNPLQCLLADRLRKDKARRETNCHERPRKKVMKLN